MTFDELVACSTKNRRGVPAPVAAVDDRRSTCRPSLSVVTPDTSWLITKKSVSPSLFTSRSTSCQVPTGVALRSNMLNANSQMKFAVAPQTPAGTAERVHADSANVRIRCAARPCSPPGRFGARRRAWRTPETCASPTPWFSRRTCARRRLPDREVCARSRSLATTLRGFTRQDVPRHRHLVVGALEYDVAVVFVRRERPDGVAERTRVHQVVAQLVAVHGELDGDLTHCHARARERCSASPTSSPRRWPRRPRNACVGVTGIRLRLHSSDSPHAACASSWSKAATLRAVRSSLHR